VLRGEPDVGKSALLSVGSRVQIAGSATAAGLVLATIVRTLRGGVT
jgi:hypothetical protein